MITNYKELCNAVIDATANKSVWEIKIHMTDKSSRIYFLSRCIRRYHKAKDAARNFGFIGVGCITFAETRLKKFQERVGRV